jgi:uncharacterized membrane protein YphA (DoxX/SURF4 family)
MWDGYAAYVKDYSPEVSDAQKKEIDDELKAARERFNRWLADQDPYTGTELPQKDVAEWRKLYAAAQARKQAGTNLIPPPAPKGEKEPPPTVMIWAPTYVQAAVAAIKSDADAELDRLTKKMQADLKNQSDVLRAQVGTPLLGDDRAKGYAPKDDSKYLWVFPKSWTLIDYLDWSTRWFLLVVGILLMVGLFTRLSCFAAAGFLLLTILTQPSVPWLPAPPVSEGNYLFVNKNVIEMVALLALMTTRSGQWAGLDAIVSWVFGGRRRNRI